LGEFITLLDNLPVGSLHITLPDFHSLDFRLQQFNESLEKNSSGRKAEIEKEIIFVQKKANKFRELLRSEEAQSIPLRVTHNDPKINNILFDENDKAICMIDLDTVMPGYIYHDFGDAIRTGTASVAEDEPENMFISLDLFEAYTKGFLSQTGQLLTSTEISMLALAPQLMTFIIGLRFLTDYVNGDIYFKIKVQNHNLKRWLAQKELLLSMEGNEPQMKRIIKNIIAKNL
jgi:serine/threonine protein kinase